MPLTQYPGRVRSIGPGYATTPVSAPTPFTSSTVDQPFNVNLALQRVGRLPNRHVVASLLGGTRLVNRPATVPAPTVRTPFANYTGRSFGSPVGMFNRVPGFGRMFRG